MAKISEETTRFRSPRALRDKIREEVAELRRRGQRDASESSVARDILLRHYGLSPAKPYKTWSESE